MQSSQAVLAALMLGAGNALAQTTVPPTLTGATSPVGGTTPRRWTFVGSANVYFLPDDRNFVQPQFGADRGRLHLEARYNYEDLETGSLWLGTNVGGGETVEFEISPMVGVAFGQTRGAAAGYKGSLTWRRLELYSEGEYFLDAGDASGNFFYSWSEASVSPAEWFRVGLVMQRTRAYEADRDVQRGLLAGFSHKRVSVTAYVFNPDDSRPAVVIGMSVTF